MEVAIAVVISLVVGFGLGYWLGHRTAAGIASDYKDVKDQLDRLRAKVGG